MDVELIWKDDLHGRSELEGVAQRTDLTSDAFDELLARSEPLYDWQRRVLGQ